MLSDLAVVKESTPFEQLRKVKLEFMTAMERWTNMFKESELSEQECDELLDL